MKLIFTFIILHLLSSCSVFQKNEYDFDRKLYAIDDNQYIDQIAHLKNVYVKTDGVREVRLSKKSKAYLEAIYYKLVSNNKLLLGSFYKPTFFIIKSDVPFYFSLPKGQFFFSSSLILKYIKNEEIFVAAFASEVVKSQRNLYLKQIRIPTGYFPTDELIAYLRVPVKVKSEINKWTYHVIKRSGHDPYAYLIWLQTLNKNTLDFSLLYGNTQDISKEEHLFKNFISKIKTEEFIQSERKRNSSSGFYSFIREVKRRGM